MTSQRERTVAEMTHAQPWLPSPTADPHSRDCYMNTSYSMHNTQSRLPVNDNDVITLGATIGTFEAVVFFVTCFGSVKRYIFKICLIAEWPCIRDFCIELELKAMSQFPMSALPLLNSVVLPVSYLLQLPSLCE